MKVALKSRYAPAVHLEAKIYYDDRTRNWSADLALLDAQDQFHGGILYTDAHTEREARLYCKGYAAVMCLHSLQDSDIALIRAP